MLIAGIVCERIMWKQGSYRNFWRNTITYGIYSALSLVGSYLPIYLYGNEYFAQAGFTGELAEIYSKYAMSPAWVSVAVIATMILAVIGCFIGRNLLRKHFIKSGIISASAQRGEAAMSEQKKAKKAGLSRLLEIAGERRGLLILSGVLSTLSTLLMFIPFVSIYSIVAELLRNAADATLINTDLIQSWGLWALLSLLAALAALYGSIMSSHVSAFRILYGLRIRATAHLAKLPMGYHNRRALRNDKENTGAER